MNTPSCRSCNTDKYLRFTNFEPGRVNVQHHRTAQGTIRKERPVSPEVEYFCGRCGSFDGISVDMGWEPPTTQMTDDEIMSECGQYAPSRGTITRRTPGGGTVTAL